MSLPVGKLYPHIRINYFDSQVFSWMLENDLSFKVFHG